MNRASIGATSFAGSCADWPVSFASDFGVSKQISMHGCRKFDRQLHRFIVRDGSELEFCHCRLLSFIRLKHEVTIDDDPHRKTRPDRQRRLDVEIALNDFLPSLIQTVALPAAKRPDDVAIVAGIRASSQLAANAQ